MRAAVIEDQALVREYLAALLHRRLGAKTVITIGSMAELKAREAELKGIKLLVLDIDLGDGTTLDWAVQRSTSDTGAVMVALSSITGEFPFKKLQAANISLVHKNDGEAELLNVVRQALGGAVVISRSAMGIIQAAGRDPLSPTKLLSARELQVLALVGQRFTNDEIAEMLPCAVGTVVDHRKRIMGKLELHSAEAVIDFAIRHGVTYDSGAAGAVGRHRS